MASNSPTSLCAEQIYERNPSIDRQRIDGLVRDATSTVYLGDIGIRGVVEVHAHRAHFTLHPGQMPKGGSGFYPIEAGIDPTTAPDRATYYAGMMYWKNFLTGADQPKPLTQGNHDMGTQGYGGGKTIKSYSVSPRLLSTEQLKAIMANEFNAMLDAGIWGYSIPAGDAMCGSREIGWMVEEGLRHLTQIDAYMGVTGKPVEHWGAAEREDSTGLGVAEASEYAATHAGFTPDNPARVKVEGAMGAVGAGTLKNLVGRHNINVDCISEYDTSTRTIGVIKISPDTYLPSHTITLNDTMLAEIRQSGLPRLEAIYHTLVKHHPQLTLEMAVAKTDQEFLSHKCHMYIPAAQGGVITQGNVEILYSSFLPMPATDQPCGGIIMEAANGPIDALADRWLSARNVSIYPGEVVNSYGVTDSRLEWRDNALRYCEPDWYNRITADEHTKARIRELRQIGRSGIRTLVSACRTLGTTDLRMAMAYVQIQTLANLAGVDANTDLLTIVEKERDQSGVDGYSMIG